MTSYAPSPNTPRLTSGPVRWSPWGWLNSAEGSPLSAGLQNRACEFPSTRLLSDIALGLSTLFRGSVPMYLIMADEVEEFQVVKPVILALAVFVMDFCLLIHGEEALAGRTSSTLMMKEFSSGCVQLRIPVIPATPYGAKLPPNPKEACHPIRTKAAPHRSPIGAQRRLG